MKVREGWRSEQIRNEAFELISRLNEKQRQVFQTIRDSGPISNEEIADALNMLPHYVTPRCLELRQLELVEFAGESHSRTSGRKVSLWKIKPQDNQLELF